MPNARVLTCNDCEIAYLTQPGREPTVVFLGGFNSHMRGTKAEAIAEYCLDSGNGFARLDYSGHGESAGRFVDATVGGWMAQALAVIDTATRGPLVLVGSSMGAWIMFLVALARRDRIAAMIGVAAAVDMTERLIEPQLDEKQREELRDSGQTRLQSDYDPQGYLISQRLLTEGREHILLNTPMKVESPLRLLHGTADSEVPWQLSLKVLESVTGSDASLTLVKGADHRFSAPDNLRLIMRTLDEFTNR